MPNYHATKCWSHLFATGTLLLLSHAISAATYSLPAGPLPSGCSRSGSQVNCTNVTLNNSDIVVVSGNVTWNVVNLTLGNGVSINSGGSPSTLTLNVTSNLNAGTGIVLTANLQAPNISIGNNAVIRGNFVSTSNITLGNNLDMQGNLQGVNINVGNNGQIIGNITASGALNLGNTIVQGTCSPSRSNCIGNSTPILGCSSPVKNGVPKMEVAAISVIDTYSKPTPTNVNFTQNFTSPPLVFTLPTIDGSNSAAHRIRNVTATGFQIMTVEPDGEDGEHVAMSLNFLAIEPGLYILPDGNKLEACYIETSRAQQSGGTHNWETLNFLSGFTAPPAMLGQIQTMRNETANLPSAPSRPWLTTAISNISSSSMRLALERSETTAGSISQTETIAYLAGMPTNGRSSLQGSTKSIDYEVIRSGEVIQGWGTCNSVYYSSPWQKSDGTRFRPIPLASMNTRDGDSGSGGSDDGGWFRRCNSDDSNVTNASQRLQLVVDEIRMGSTNRDGNRTHSKSERAGIFIFSDNFVTTPVNLHHYEFEHTANGLTCEPATITLKACQDASCNTLYTGNVTVDLTPSGSNSTWSGTNVQANQVDFSGGRVVLQLAQTSAATVTLGASGTPAAPNTTVCLKDGTAGNCQMSFASGGSSFTLAPPIDNLGCKAANWTITAASCGSNKLNGQKNIRFWYEYVTPASPISPVAPTLNGTALPATDPGAGNGRSLSFINGVATIPGLRYTDAGRLRILAAYQGTSATGDAGVSLSGNATSVFRPLALWVDDPASSCAAGNSSCTAYRKAGESFDLSVKAVCWDAADDTDNNGIADSGANLGNNALMPNFSITEAVLAPELLAPSGGANAVLTDATGTPGNDQFSASSGNATVSSLRLSEVGVFRFTAQGSYLGTNIPAAPGTGKPVGRFYPHHFDTEVLPAHTTFTYSGQPFPIKIAAKNLANSTTVNYTGAFARTTTLSDANGNAGSYNPATLSAADFASGIADATTPARIAFTFTNKLTAPATICVRAGDGETSSASGSEGSTPLRSGRLLISNAHGSEHLQLSMPIQTQYWNGSVWLTNTLDSYTSLIGALVTNTSPCSTPTPGPIANGRGSLTFPAPGSPCGVDICAQLGSDANHALTACQPAVAGRAIWLQGSWDSDGNYDDNPAARATFGIFSGRQPIIYRRERY